MIDQQLLDYVNQQLISGTDRVEIKRVLLDSGWHESEINAAIEQATNLFTHQNIPAGLRNSGKKFLLWALLAILIVGGVVFVYSRRDGNVVTPPVTSSPTPILSPSATPTSLPTSFNNLVFAVESQYASKHSSYTQDVAKIVSLVNGVYQKNTQKQFTWKAILYNGVNSCDYAKDQRICDELLNNPQIQANDIPIFIGSFGSGLGGGALDKPRTHIVIETCSALKPVIGPMGNTECDWSGSVEGFGYIVTHELGHVFGVGHNGSLGVKDLTESSPIIQGDLLPTAYSKDPMVANLGNTAVANLEFGPLSAFIIDDNLDRQKTRNDYEIYPQTIKLKVADSNGIPIAGASVKLFCAGEYEYSAQVQEKNSRFAFTTDANGEAVLQSFSRPEGWFSIQDTQGPISANPKILDNACTLTLVKINKASYVGEAIPIWSFLLRKARVMDGAKIYTIPVVLNQKF